MIIISHRINSLKKLRETNKKYGVEVDIRSYGEQLIIHHDPFVKGENFYNWIKYYDHKMLILNVKEEGLESKLIKCMNSLGIKDYFFLDQSFPFLIKCSNDGLKNCATRVSEFENLNTALSLRGKIDWIWVDCFTKFPLNRIDYDKLKDASFKMCLVSPELQGQNAVTAIPKMKLEINKINIKIDAVCTKRPDLWEI